MKERYNYELIKDYLNGTLESETSRALEKLLREDETARAIAKGVLILNEHFGQDEEKIEKYLDGLQLRQIGKTRQRPSSSKMGMFLRVAASLALLIVVSFGIYRYAIPDLEDYLAVQLAETYPAPSITRNGEDPDDDYLMGLASYRNGKYQEAWSLLSTSDSPVGVFYSGLCQLYLQQYDEAIQILNKELLQKSIFAQHSKWYLSLAYLKTNQENEAVLLLYELSESDGFKSEEARRMKRLIEQD